MFLKLSIISFCLILSARAFAARELELKCTKGHADSCANLGAITFAKNPQKAKKFYQRSCDLGKKSSCVFYGQNSKATAAAQTNTTTNGYSDNDIIVWANSTLKFLLPPVTMYTGDGSESTFQLKGCQHSTVIDEATRGLRTVTEKFGENCDLEGKYLFDTTSELKSTVQQNFKVRHLADVAQFIFMGDQTVLKDGDGLMRQQLVVSDAQVLSADGQVIAKFDFRIDIHFRNAKYGSKEIKYFNVIPLIKNYRGHDVNVQIAYPQSVPTEPVLFK